MPRKRGGDPGGGRSRGAGRARESWGVVRKGRHETGRRPWRVTDGRGEKHRSKPCILLLCISAAGTTSRHYHLGNSLGCATPIEDTFRYRPPPPPPPSHHACNRPPPPPPYLLRHPPHRRPESRIRHRPPRLHRIDCLQTGVESSPAGFDPLTPLAVIRGR